MQDGNWHAGESKEKVILRQHPAGGYEIEIGNRIIKAHLVARNDKEVTLLLGNRTLNLTVKNPNDLLIEKMGFASAATAKAADLKAPLPGLIKQILVTEGQEVAKGTPLLVIEAMKMENILKAPADGRIAKIEVGVGQAVEKNQKLIKF